jgi:PPOX class probable F420-dependent enzyme
MSARAIRGMLGRRLIAGLATVDAGGRPHVVPIWFRWDGDHLLFPTSSRTRKVRNLERHPYAAATIHEGSGMGIRGVMLRGPVEIVGGSEARRLNRAIHLRYVSARDLRRAEIAAYLDGDDVTLRMAVEETVSWDIAGMDHRASGGR